MSFLVNGLTDVEGGEGREDQSLDGTGKQAKEHDRQWHKQGHQGGQNGHCQFVGKDVAKQTEGQGQGLGCLLYTSPSPRDGLLSRMPSSA